MPPSVHDDMAGLRRPHLHRCYSTHARSSTCRTARRSQHCSALGFGTSWLDPSRAGGVDTAADAQAAPSAGGQGEQLGRGLAATALGVVAELLARGEVTPETADLYLGTLRNQRRMGASRSCPKICCAGHLVPGNDADDCDRRWHPRRAGSCPPTNDAVLMSARSPGFASASRLAAVRCPGHAEPQPAGGRLPTMWCGLEGLEGRAGM